MKQVPKDAEENERETVELKPLSEIEEDSVPKDQAEKKPERPGSVEETPKETAQTDQRPKKPKSKKTRRDTPDELPKAEEAGVSSIEEQVCHFFCYRFAP